MRTLFVLLLLLVCLFPNSRSHAATITYGYTHFNQSQFQLFVSNQIERDLSRNALVKEFKVKDTFLNPTKVNHIRKELIGSWRHTYFPAEAYTADLNEQTTSFAEPVIVNYEFRSDGTYLISVCGGNKVMKENGFWDISTDANELIFYFEENGIEKTANANIKHIQMDELVLEQKLRTGPISLCTDFKSLYFNKLY